MSIAEDRKNDLTRLIEQTLGDQFKNVEAYRYNSASIRVRIVDERFRGKSDAERSDLVTPFLDELPQEVQDDITILLLLTEDEKSGRLMNLEFENPSPSLL